MNKPPRSFRDGLSPEFCAYMDRVNAEWREQMRQEIMRENLESQKPGEIPPLEIVKNDTPVQGVLF